MILHFDSEHVRQLLEASRATTSRKMTMTQRYSVEFLKPDVPEDRRQELLSSANEGISFDIREEEIDQSRIPVGLRLVGDQGVYLMSQASNEEMKARGVSHVAYAKEADPTRMDFDSWWRAKRISFGPDDGVEFLPADSVEKALSGKTFDLNVTPQSIEILSPQGPGNEDMEP